MSEFDFLTGPLAADAAAKSLAQQDPFFGEDNATCTERRDPFQTAGCAEAEAHPGRAELAGLG